MNLFKTGMVSWFQPGRYGFLMGIMMLVAGCGPGPDIPLGRPSPPPTLTPIQSQALLEVVYPLASTELIGGQELRVALVISDKDGKGVEGAAIQVDLFSLDESIYFTFMGDDQGEGRYLTDAVNLPLRDAAGAWKLQANAELKDGQCLQSSGSFTARQSFSEGLEEQYGFWIDLPTPPFAYTGPSFADPKLKFHPYQDGGGYVILTNLPVSGSVAEVSMLDIHWRPTSYPTNHAAALAYINDLAGPHGMTVSYIDLEAGESNFLSRSAWLISGRWVEPLNSGDHPTLTTYPAEWIIFSCPESDHSWTLMITSQNSLNLPELRELLDTFRCPASY